MKPTSIIFALAAFLFVSCTRPGGYSSANKIGVYNKAGIKKNYDLLSVRGDTAIVVSFWDESDSLHVQSIKQDSISRIVREKSGVSEDYSSLMDIKSPLEIILIPLILPVALLVDAIITKEGPPIELATNSYINSGALRLVARYPDTEPEMLQNIK